MRAYHWESTLAVHIFALGLAASAWAGHRTQLDSESLPSSPCDCGVVTEVEWDPVSNELLEAEPRCRPKCGRSACLPAGERKTHLKPLFVCRSPEVCRGSVPPTRAVGVEGRRVPVGLLNVLGYHSFPMEGTSPAGRVPVPGMPPGALGPYASGAPYPGDGGMVQEYPTSVPPGMTGGMVPRYSTSVPPDTTGAAAQRWMHPAWQADPTSVPPGMSGVPLNGRMLPNGEMLPEGAVVVPNEATPAAAPQPTRSSTTPRTVQPTSLESPLVELNTPDEPLSSHPKPSSKFEAITP